MFLLGAATAPHQVEGNNINSDYWVQENIAHSQFVEKSGSAVDHYNRYEEDIKLLAQAGLNCYRFGIEWARIQPQEGVYDKKEIEHYQKVLACCKANGVTPIVTMHHFSSPKWLISMGGWENEKTVTLFADYCERMAKELGSYMEYVCTINEANMGLQLDAIAQSILKRMKAANVQVGMNFANSAYALTAQEEKQAFGCDKVNVFLSGRTKEGDKLIMRAHELARDKMKAVCPHLKIGLTLSLHDMQYSGGGKVFADNEWDMEFNHYLPYIEKDDYLGVQCYTRKIFDESGYTGLPAGTKKTQMDYENYPQAIGNVVKKVAEKYKGEIIVTENGIATADDAERIEFISEAVDSVVSAKKEGVNITGYCYWSLIDNFEWQKGFAMQFGLIAVDRKTMERIPKKSLYALGHLKDKVK